MARLLHCADAHLGMLTHSRPDPATGIPSRILDTGRSWHRACEIAVARGVDGVVAAGDMFHSRSPDAVSLHLFAQGLRLLSEHAIPTVLIPGNHDGAAHPGRPSVVEVFASDDVQVRTSAGVVDLDGLRIACLPWASRQRIIAEAAGMSRAEAVTSTTDALQWVLQALWADDAAVLTGHWSVQGAVLGNERDIAIVGEHEVVLPTSALEGPWRYAAFGHIHKHQVSELTEGPTLAYAGSMDRKNFGEEGHTKVVIEVDTELGDLTTHELPARSYQTFVAGIDHPGQDTDVEGAIVRVRDCPREAADGWRADLERRGAHQVYIEVARETPAPVRSARVTAELGLPAAMDAWMDLHRVDPLERGALVEAAKLLEQEVQT